MGALSGKFGEVSAGASLDINELISWDAEIGDKIEEYASRAGNGWMQTVDGVGSAKGNIVVNLDPASSITTAIGGGPGTLVMLTLYATTTGPVVCAGMARLGPFKYSAKRSGEVQQISIPFTGHGPWVQP